MREKPQHHYLPSYFHGLDSLRFYAALLVFLNHVVVNQRALEIPMLPNIPPFQKGHVAVCFFFTLSGFLITHILLKERAESQSVNLKSFYRRRILRIWPVYFLVALFGFLFYWWFLPMLGIAFEREYNLGIGILAYVFFMPNILASVYKVGGILNVLWSIGIEEQFYLFWAPIMKFITHRLGVVILGLLVLVSIFQLLTFYEVISLSDAGLAIVYRLKFHYMLAGAILAYGINEGKSEQIVALFFRNKFFVQLMIVLIASFVLLFPMAIFKPWMEIPLIFVFLWLIGAAVLIPDLVGVLMLKGTRYLGQISYGIYMYHMIALYMVSFFFKNTLFLYDSMWYHVCYLTLSGGITVLMAHFSYSFYEKWFLMRKYQSS